MCNKYFFVVGAPKCGTTSLYFYLKEHDEIYLPEQKELHYFSLPEVDDTFYPNNNIIRSEQQYRGLYKDVAGKKICGDISPSYLYHQKSAGRIKDFSDDAKIIIILRDPVKRAISHYMMDRNKGFVDVELMEILEQPKNYSAYHKEYVGMGLYSAQVDVYKKLFSDEQISILFFEEFFEDVNASMQDLHGFLSVKPRRLTNKEGRNVYGKPRINYHKIKRRLPGTSKVVALLPSPVKTYIKNVLTDRNAEKPLFDEEKEYLYHNHYKQDIRRLERIVGKDLSVWKSY